MTVLTLADIDELMALIRPFMQPRPMTLMVSVETRAALRKMIAPSLGVRVKGSRGTVVVYQRGDRWRVKGRLKP